MLRCRCNGSPQFETARARSLFIMSNLWQALELLAHSCHVSAEWAKCSGEHFGPLRAVYLRDTQRRARHVACLHGCGCQHEIIEREPGQFVAVCRCEPWDCQDFIVRAEELPLWEFNAAKFGRAVARAFDCDLRETTLPLPKTWQVGAKFANGVPVFLTIQAERTPFNRVVVELVARQRQPFILLTPTTRWLDASSRELLAGVKAKVFDLESTLVLLPSGVMQARKSGGELFAAFQPDVPESAPEDVARAAWAIINKLDSGKSRSEPSAVRVFKHYCQEGLSADKLAIKYGWAKGTVMNRLEEIEKATGLDKKQLRVLSGHMARVEEQLTDDRAGYIHRKTQAHGLDDQEDESV